MPNIYCEPDIIIWDGKIISNSGRPKTLGDGIVEVRGREIFVCAPNGVSFLTLRWKCRVSGSLAILGDAFERAYGNLEWRGIVPERVMPWYCVTNDGTTCEGYGVRVRPNAFCYWQLDQAGVSLTLDLRCGGGSVFLHKELCAAELVYLWEESPPYAFMKRFCLAMSDNPVTAGHPVYGSNSWYYLYSGSTPELIRKDAQLMAELSEGLDVKPYTVVDCGWSESLTPENPVSGTAMARGNALFGDMRYLSEEIKAHGVRPGLWLRPLCISTPLSVPKKYLLRPDMLDFHNKFVYGCAAEFLDPSVPSALEVIAADIRKVTMEWGYELIKPDFLTYDLFGEFHNIPKTDCTHNNWRFNDINKTSAQIVKTLYETITKNAGGALIIGCNAIGHLASGYFHINRIGDDTSGESFERTRRMGVNSLAFRLCQHKVFFDIDIDCVGQTESMPWEINRQWLKLATLSGAPLFVSFNPNKITPEQKAALRESFWLFVNRENSLEPLDFSTTTCPMQYLLNGNTVEEFNLIEPSGVTDVVSI